MENPKKLTRKAEQLENLANMLRLQAQLINEKKTAQKNQLKDIVKLIGVDAMGILAVSIIGILDPFIQANANINLACCHPIYTLFAIGFLAYNVVVGSSILKQ